ncbi:protein KIAA0556 homolog [Agrilus planipennis]|uniref:Protein KIAA0556 homolog n=1 Tax=Agrilus planipennis TaxID=224129 RepID=A0A1W4X267_AGRPL|nr:protein KIAA0556 homolog [Agrilus planipennis]
MDLFNKESKQLLKQLESGTFNPSSHRLPQWFKEISQETLEKIRETKVKEATKKLCRLYSSPINKSSMKSSFDISPMENGNGHVRNSFKSAKETRKSIDLKEKYPTHTQITESNYIVPKMKGALDFHSFEEECKKQNYLEKSWQSLSSFHQTQRGRLSKRDTIAQNRLKSDDSDEDNLSKGPPKSYSAVGLTRYTPTVLENEESKSLRDMKSKRGKSSNVPFYVYSNIKKVTDQNSYANLDLDDFGAFDYTLKNKSKSTNDICDAKTTKRLNNGYNNYLAFDTDAIYYTDLDKLLYQPRINKQFEEYRQKVNTNIEGILTLSGRISARLREDCKRNMQKVESQNDIYATVQKPKLKSINSLPNSKAYNSFHAIERDVNLEEPPFVIPTLPTGKFLKIDILSTWGDKHYVGLNGIEIFGTDGRMVNVKRIRAFPPDVNILPENNNDPRVVENLLDGINRTQDDVHLWLAPFNIGSKHEILIEFTNITTVTMIRIWNYNKSRIHSYRGVKDIIITLDTFEIFKGEIVKACGGILGGVDAFGDTILFTLDDHILELISRNDRSFSSLIGEPDHARNLQLEGRPPTVAVMDERPITGTTHNFSNLNLSEKTIGDCNEKILLGISRLDLVLLKNWGYTDLIGLTGFEILRGSDEPLNLSGKNLRCSFNSPSDIMERLINGDNFTTDAKKMWSIPFVEQQKVVLSVVFDEVVYVSGK